MTDQLIFVHDKRRDAYVDKTSEIVGLRPAGAYVYVDYGAARVFRYRKEHVVCYPLLATRRQVRIYKDGTLQEPYDTLFDYGKYVRLGAGEGLRSPAIEKSRIEAVDAQPLPADKERLLSYFAEVLAAKASLESETDTEAAEEVPEGEKKSSIAALLAETMQRIDPQDPRTALYAYLNGRTAACDVDNVALVYPFGCNASQKLAVQRALGNRVSVVEGPPGTGKTQTILNIVANLLMQGKTVGVVSNNNAAVDNVRDKLSKYEYGALMAELGNRTRRQAFFADKQQDFMPDPTWRLPAEETLLCPMRVPSSAVGTTAGRSADAAGRPLFLPSDRQPACAVVPASRYREVAGRKAVARFAGRTAVPVRRVAREAAVRGCGAAARLCRSQVLRNLYRRALGPHRPARGTVRRAACEEPDRSIREGVGSAVPRYALPQIRTPERSAARGAAPVHDAELPDAFPHLRRTLSGRAEYDPFAVRFDRRGAPARLCHHRRVVAGRYAVCCACCRNIIIIGDSRQLPHIVEEQLRAKAEELRDKHRVPDAYDYVRQNILSSFKRVFGERLPVTLLREHYRCHPLIIDFCNRKYYRNELLIMTEPKGDYPFTVLTTTASKTYSHNGRIYNQRQIDATCDWIERQHTEYAAMRFASDAKRESPAERIAERLIGGILAEEDRFSAIGVHRHYRLYDLVGRNVELSDEERLFVRRRSHLDFLLYNRMDNTPILGIEVDGVLHHRFDEVQVARDRRKNGILVKIGLPLLRLSTDGSSEKERIVGALEQAMQQG